MVWIRYFRAKGREVEAMAACLPFLLLPPLLLLLILATLGVGGPSFHSLFGHDAPLSKAKSYIKQGLGGPQKPQRVSLDTFLLGSSGPPVKGLYGDFIGTKSSFLGRRRRSSPPHIDPYYRYFTQPHWSWVHWQKWPGTWFLFGVTRTNYNFGNKIAPVSEKCSHRSSCGIITFSTRRQNVTVQQGVRGRLFCRVYNLANRSLSQLFWLVEFLGGFFGFPG